MKRTRGQADRRCIFLQISKCSIWQKTDIFSCLRESVPRFLCRLLQSGGYRFLKCTLFHEMLRVLVFLNHIIIFIVFAKNVMKKSDFEFLPKMWKFTSLYLLIWAEGFLKNAIKNIKFKFGLLLKGKSVVHFLAAIGNKTSYSN